MTLEELKRALATQQGQYFEQPVEAIPGLEVAPKRQQRFGINPADYDTKLSPDDEQRFLAWKQQYAPRDSGQDYDLRGAYQEGLQPDPETGHWPDTYKKPNHETFSDESKYANYRAGKWTGPNHDIYEAPLDIPQSDPALDAAPKFAPDTGFRAEGKRALASGAMDTLMGIPEIIQALGRNAYPGMSSIHGENPTAGEGAEAALAKRDLVPLTTGGNVGRFAASVALPFAGSKALSVGKNAAGALANRFRKISDVPYSFEYPNIAGMENQSGRLDLSRAPKLRGRKLYQTENEFGVVVDDNGMPIDKGRLVGTDDNLPPLTMKRVLDARSQQMGLKPKDRIQPSADDAVIDTSIGSYNSAFPSQVATPVPRLAAGAVYPKGGRAQAIVDNTEAIAQIIAERARPYVGTEAQYFYNTYGPIMDAARKQGISDDVTKQWIIDFGKHYAATSPRTETAQNIRNATLLMAKKQMGLEMGDIVGAGTKNAAGESGISEHGYPMMTGKSGIHRKLSDAVDTPDGMSFDTNPKPATFAENAAGNLEGVTVDTHAIRGVIDALNEMTPGGVPEEWILPKYRAQYKADPSKLDASRMIDDTLASKAINKKSSQVEYGAFSDVYKRVADILGISPAQAQALGWFASGSKTGLQSANASIPTLLNQRISVTSKAMDRSPGDVLKALIQDRSIPLMGVGSGSIMLGDEQEKLLENIKPKKK